jgi:hypothetical protein
VAEGGPLRTANHDNMSGKIVKRKYRISISLSVGNFQKEDMICSPSIVHPRSAIRLSNSK